MFVGRDAEIAQLRRNNWRDRAVLIAVYGRRRVGKTALIEKAFEGHTVWKFEGIEGESTRKQIRHFLRTLSACSGDSTVPLSADDWQDALLHLAKRLPKSEVVLFFDEFQWTAAMRSHLVSVFKWAWDNHLSKHRGCRVVLCGSISSFIVRKVIRSKALYGRVDLEIDLKPFTPAETCAFLGSKRSRAEALETHMAVGGIPQYLQELRPDLSVTQNLHELGFVPNGYFVREYHRLFVSHFSKNPVYGRVLSSLASRHIQSREDLANAVGVKPGGVFSVLLEDLELAGFIERVRPLDAREGGRLLRLRMADEFLHFYFSFIDPNRAHIQSGSIKGYDLLTGPAYEQWRGYAFERLCRKNAKAIARALEFSGIRYSYGAWFQRAPTNAQVDLLFDRADGVLTVCEAKYVERPAAAQILRSCESKVKALRERFDRPMQKVLVLGRPAPIPEQLRKYFDAILFAHDTFF